MLTSYIRAAMRQARYEIVEDDGSFYGQIPAIPGVWANAKTLEACREELESVLEGWVKRRDLIACLHALGFEPPVSGGDHQYMKGRGRKLRIPNPHTEDIGRGLLVRILRQAGNRAGGMGGALILGVDLRSFATAFTSPAPPNRADLFPSQLFQPIDSFTYAQTALLRSCYWKQRGIPALPYCRKMGLASFRTCGSGILAVCAPPNQQKRDSRAEKPQRPRFRH
jgi:predicted RNase H-like HicB family nuclease